MRTSRRVSKAGYSSRKRVRPLMVICVHPNPPPEEEGIWSAALMRLVALPVPDSRLRGNDEVARGWRGGAGVTGVVARE